MNRSSKLGCLWAKNSPWREAARRPRGRARLATLRLLESLEDRLLLTTSAQFDHILLNPGTGAMIAAIAPAFGTTTPYGFAPQQIRSAYGINAIQVGSVTGTGAGQTIAIVDAYDDPDLVSSTASNFLTSDLHEFDSLMNLPDPPSFRKLDEYGGTNYPSTDPSGPGNSWAVEESLDVEWAHVIAPQANIVLIEANSSLSNDLETAVSTAANLPGVSVVSMSWGMEESASEASLDPLFTTPAGHAGVTYVASAGDSGAPGGYPAFSPNVLAVGGTYLTAPGGIYQGETAWSPGTGGGQSWVEGEPSYQTGLQQSGSRQMPDVAFDASPYSGVAVYDSYDFGPSTPWETVGGTSLAAPCWAGLIAIADQLRASRSLPPLDGPTQTLPALYGLPATDFHDITSGNNGYPAGPGYDMCTGLGSPVASKLVPDLAAFASPSDLVTATASTSDPIFGQSITFTASVLGTPGSGTPTGTVTFRDGSLVLGTVGLDAAGQASISTSALNAGDYTITAAYGGDSLLPANSTVVVEPISPDSTTTVVNSSSATLTFGQSVTLTATVTAAPLNSATPTGMVTFLSGSTVVGTATLTGGVAMCTINTLPAGTDVVTAVYSGDGLNFAGSTSALVGPGSIISTVAGNGHYGETGDGGPATQANLFFPQSVAVDAAGDIFLAEVDSRIREVNHATGVITTIAGDGTEGDTGDGGPATDAEIGYPMGLTLDGAGNLYFSDWDYDVVRKVNLATGVITTVAGNENWGYSGDGGPATAAELYLPDGLAVDAAGDLFIADYYNFRVREVNHATGVITTVAGNGGLGNSGDGGLATTAQLGGPESVGFDAAGDLFVLDAYTGVSVREVNHATGVITTVAGDNAFGWNSSGDGGLATAAQLGAATGMAVDASGDLFVTEWSTSDTNGGVIREVNHATDVITALAGNGTASLDGSGGPGASAYLADPYGIAVDANGELFIADSTNCLVSRIEHESLSVTVNRATPTVTVTDSGGTYNGSAYPASALIAGVVSGVDSSPASSLEGVSPTITYYAGSSVNGTGSTAPPTGAGTYTVVATFPASTDYTTASSNPLTFTITKAAPALADAGGTYNGQSLPATVAGISGTAGLTLEGVGLACAYYASTGTGGTNLGGTAPTRAGTYTVVASFPGSGDYASVSQQTTFSIARAAPALTLTDSGGTYDGSPYPASAFASGVVSGIDTAPAQSLEGVTLALTYYVGTGTSGTSLAGTAPTHAGSYTVVANFPGSADYAVASSNPLTFTITKAAPALADAGGTYTGQSFPATVAGISGTAGLTLDEVGLACTYYAGSQTSGASLGSLAPTDAGTYTVVASFPGSSNYAPYSKQMTFTIARAAPGLTVTDAGGPYDGLPFAASALVAGVVSGMDTTPEPSLEGVSPTLTYYVGADTSGPNLGRTAPAGTGTYTVVAGFPGSPNYTPASHQTTFTITQATPLLHFSVATPVITAGQAVVLAATVTYGVGAPTGSVTFLDDGSPLGTATLSDGVATWVASSLGAGLHSLSALYQGSSDFTTGLSTTQVVTVTADNRFASSTSLTVSTSAITFGHPTKLTARVSSGTIPHTGSVTFLDGQTPIGTVTLVKGLATLTVRSLGVGAHSLSAQYNGSSQVESSRSIVRTVTVNGGGHPRRPARGKVAQALRHSAPVLSGPVPLGPLSVIRITRH